MEMLISVTFELKYKESMFQMSAKHPEIELKSFFINEEGLTSPLNPQLTPHDQS